MKVRPQVVVFDFDYTLADSSDGVIDCVQSSQQQMDLPVSDPESIRRTIGLSVPDTLACLNGEHLRVRSDEFGQLFRSRADEVMVGHTRLYDGVPQMLAALADNDITCAIATTKYRYRIEQILTRDGLMDAIAAIVGAEDVQAHKPDPACLVCALERLRFSPRQAIYVGDSAPDAEAAQRAGIGFVLVETGLAAPETFETFPRLTQLAHVRDLPAWLAGMETE
ncbi:MAG: HAD-IA family hydrolase [Gemmatimonadetes bacterium]|jgi:phosphoglycolate phosphatase|nr:HAD-IA family hydrolase [Gemmatimonadota bacterium]MBT6149232.1 HAD-IA family hydrolase [Gemmatimonadota bacterium]MBT7862695.1 HAD-IA family hydrolase [Gemmatimonadota bacterium]